MIIVLIGPTGSGKTTLAEELEKASVPRVITSTTRNPREGETSKSYNFTTREAFEAGIDRGDFVEYTEYRDNYYGVNKTSLSDTCVVVLELNGYRALKALYKEKVFGLFLEVTEQERMLRARNRGDSLKEVSERVLADRSLYSDFKHSEVDLVLTDMKKEEIPKVISKNLKKWQK